MRLSNLPASIISELAYAPERPPAERGSDVAAPYVARNAALSGLAGTAMADLFRAWNGRSGRRHVFSVYPIGADGEGLDRAMADGPAIVLAAERQAGGQRDLLWVGEAGPEAAGFFAALTNDETAPRRFELHLHLTARDAVERQAIIADLCGMLG